MLFMERSQSPNMGEISEEKLYPASSKPRCPAAACFRGARAYM